MYLFSYACFMQSAPTIMIETAVTAHLISRPSFNTKQEFANLTRLMVIVNPSHADMMELLVLNTTNRQYCPTNR